MGLSSTNGPKDASPVSRLLCFVIFCALAAATCTVVACSIGAKVNQHQTPLSSEDFDRAEDSNIDADGVADVYMQHAKLFTEDRYPSAFTCKACHENHFREWSVSQHAYAQLSPIFNAMQATINKRTNGTNGDFCVRCHTQVGMALGEDVHMSNMDRAQVSREGVTCITCHRVAENYGKVSGRLAIHQGPLTDPIKGPTGNEGLKEVLAEAASNRVVTDEESIGRKIHGDAEKFFAITTPAFCGSCHDVTLFNGFRLEEAFSEYKHSPANADGQTCQDCHMSTSQGSPTGFRQGPAAVVAGKPTRVRQLSNHYFAGPDHSVIHPLLFPFNADVYQRWTMRQMIAFDWKKGWGTDEFEDLLVAGKAQAHFSEPWDNIDERYEARAFIEKNLDLLKWADGERKTVLQAGYAKPKVIDIERGAGLAFKVETGNSTAGHNVPTGFTAERVTWLHVQVHDASGRQLFVSGDTDPNGDIRDEHSLYVHNGELPRDPFLFSLQSKFLVRMNRGGESEEILPINHSVDPLPFVRPSRFASTLSGKPQGARIEKRGIPAERTVRLGYALTPAQLAGAQWPLKISVELKAGMVPVHLINEVKGVGFDYNMSARDLGDAVHKGQMVVWRIEHQLAPQSAAVTTDGGAGE